MTLGFYISELRSLLSEDKKLLDNREIVRYLTVQRTYWLRNNFNKLRDISQDLLQTITVNMDYDTLEPYLNVSESKILKSDVVIPRTIARYTKDSIMRVYLSNITSIPLNYIKYSDVPYSGNGRFNKADIFCFLFNNYLYIKLSKENPNIKFITEVNIDAVFEDQVAVYTDYITDDYVSLMDIEFPMGDSVWAYIRQQVVNEGLQTIEATQTEKSKDI